MSLLATDFHPGEVHLHQQLKVPEGLDNPTAPGHSLRYYAALLSQVPLFAIGTLDHQNRPWSTLWGGSPGLSQLLGRDILGIKAAVDAKSDPVVQALFDGSVEDGKVVKGGAEGRRMVSALAVDLEGRKRVKLFGRMVVCAIGAEKEEEDVKVREEPSGGVEDEEIEKKMTVQLVLQMEQVLGNCPKYINKKALQPVKPKPELVSEGSKLSDEALNLISEADMFFMSSSNADQDMDTNHRGGTPGFVRCLYNATTCSHELIYPEYSGNRLYQTLGNLHTTPYAGLVIPNFITGDVLYITGTTSIHIGQEASALLPHSNLIVQINITDHKFIKRGLPFIASNPTLSDKGRSPYNPRLRLLASEQPRTPTSNGSETRQTATLVSQTQLTPTISRFSFSLSNPSSSASPMTWKSGQYVMLDLSSELNEGYSHMRDDDPRSINDDFIRSFTVSSPPPISQPSSSPTSPHPHHPSQPVSTHTTTTDESNGSTFTLTLRKIPNGPVTSFLFRHGLSKPNRSATTAPLDLPILGFSGSFGFNLSQARDLKKNDDAKLVYICSGVGVTPLLAQMDELAADTSANANGFIGRLLVFWTVHIDDVAFVVDTLIRVPGLLEIGMRMKVFVTGVTTSTSTSNDETLQTLQSHHHIQFHRRRFQEDDFAILSQRKSEEAEAEAETETKTKHQVCVCANPHLTLLLREWMLKLDVEVVSEDFAY